MYLSLIHFSRDIHMNQQIIRARLLRPRTTHENDEMYSSINRQIISNDV